MLARNVAHGKSRIVTNALPKLFNAKPLRSAAFRQNRQSKYALEHILRPSIHPHSVMARHAPVRCGEYARDVSGPKD